jgi:hypothetical protein
MPGDVVAILGIGGLGHLGVQFANKLGFRTVAIAPAPTRRRSPASWARTTSSITRLRTWPGHSTPWAGRGRYSRPLPAPRQ